MSRQDDGVKTDKSDCDSVAQKPISNSKNGEGGTTTNINGKPVYTIPAADAQNTTDSRRAASNVNSPHFVPNFREHMVAKATEFLVALPAQSDMSVERKFNFLRSKGLSDQEIHMSLHRASMICRQHPNPSNNSLPQGYSSNGFGVIQTPIESQGWFRRLFQPIAYAVAIAYVGYHMYKKYIEKWLFGNQKSSLERRFDVLELSVQRCITLIEKTNIDVPNENISRQTEIDQIKAELKSIKRLLLNKCHFPPAPTFSSIPQWQLIKTNKQQVEQSSDNANGIQVPSLPQQKEDGDGTLNLLQQKEDNGTETSPNLPQKGKVNGALEMLSSLQQNLSNESDYVSTEMDSPDYVDCRDKSILLNKSILNGTSSPMSLDSSAMNNDVAD